VISFSLSELGCKSLSYVYKMTWAEYLIRVDGWKRRDQTEWYRAREIAWAALIGSHLDPKKLPKNKDDFIPIGTRKKKPVSDRMLHRMREAKEKYLREIEENGRK